MPLDLALILPADGPRGIRLVEALRQAILDGRLPSGARLPASRALAQQLHIARGTVVTAYEELVSEGYCAARVGAGTFVADVLPRPAAHNGRTASSSTAPAGGASHAQPVPHLLSDACGTQPQPFPEGRHAAPRGATALSDWGDRLRIPHRRPDAGERVRYDFRSGIAPELFPAELLGRALRRAAIHQTDGGAGDPAGSLRLRRALVASLARTRGLRADPSQMVIVGGSQQGLDLATRLLLNPGDPICIEEPGYPRALAVLRALGARRLPVPVDGGGLVTAALPAGGARMAYVTPSHQHPTGAVLAPDRRLVLLAWAERHDAWVLEDDYDSEYRYGGPPLPCLQGLDRAGRCLYIGSLSKLLHPSLRVGYLVAPPWLMPKILAAKSTLDQATPPFVQEALADLFESGEVERHLRRSMRAYRVRRTRLLAACAAHLPPRVRLWPVTGGVHAFVEIPGVRMDRLLSAAADHSVAFVNAADCYDSPPPDARLVLWFSRIAADQIEPGIAALGKAIREVMGDAG